MYEFARSTSQRRCYHQCPLKWYYRYGHGWRTTYFGAAQMQGIVYHRVKDLLLHQLGQTPIAMVDYFVWLWEGVQAQLERDARVKYPESRNSALYMRRGQKFWSRFPDEILTVLTPPACPPLGSNLPVRMVERSFTFPLVPAKHDVSPETVIPDYVGPAWVPNDVFEPGMGGHRSCNVVIDFKTSDYLYDETRAEIDEQLTDGQLAIEHVGGTIDAVGLCVMVCQEKNPAVQWLWAPARTVAEKGPFLTNAVLTDQAIRRGIFPRNDQHCHQWGGCDMQPICFKSQHRRLAEELEQSDPRRLRDQILLEEL